MSEQYFLEKCIICAEDAKASFSNMSHLNLDQQARQQYELAVENMNKSIRFFNSRLLYLKKMNKS